MANKLDQVLKRELEITWRAIISGDANLSEDLSASVDASSMSE